MEYDYVCNKCEKLTSRDNLIVKKALFTEMGSGANTIKARVVAWLCDQCAVRDPDWLREAHVQPSQRIPRKESVDGW